VRGELIIHALERYIPNLLSLPKAQPGDVLSCRHFADRDTVGACFCLFRRAKSGYGAIPFNSCIQGFEVGANCVAAVVIMATTGGTSAQWHHVAAVARVFWSRWSSIRHWLAHEIVQQPVKLFRSKSAKVPGMPDFIGCLQFFAF
jgi:hypothetical protein